MARITQKYKQNFFQKSVPSIFHMHIICLRLGMRTIHTPSWFPHCPVFLLLDAPFKPIKLSSSWLIMISRVPVQNFLRPAYTTLPRNLSRPQPFQIYFMFQYFRNSRPTSHEVTPLSLNISILPWATLILKTIVRCVNSVCDVKSKRLENEKFSVEFHLYRDAKWRLLLGSG